MKSTQNILIKQIEIYQSPIKLKEPFITSLGTLEFAENVIADKHIELYKQALAEKGGTNVSS